jgi:hypothetical protein
MGKSILELFKNQKLTGGQTGEKQYDIRNSKDINISSANGALNATSFAAVNKLRKGKLSVQRGETFIEQETTGLRPLRLLSEPIIYGTDIIRINTQTTTMKDVMKSGTGAEGGSGIVGGLISKIKLKGLELASKIGIKLPYELIPTRIVQDSEFLAGKESDTMITLAKIKGDSAGNIVGKFLANNANGTPSQIGNAIIGGGIDLLKNEVKKKLFGSGLPDQRVYAAKSATQIQYDSVAPYSKTVDAKSSDALTRHDLSSLLVQRDANQKTAEKSGNSVNKLKAGSRLPEQPKETAPLNTANQPFASITDKINSVRGDMLGKLAGARKEGQQILARTGLDRIPQKDDGTQVKKSEMVDASADDPKLRNDLSTKIMALYNEKNPAYATTGPQRDETKKYSKLKNEERTSMAVTRRMGFGYGRDLADTGDIINNTITYSGQNGKDAAGGLLDDYDFIPLKFYSVAQNKTVQFRATLSGLSETTSPSWDSNKFMGSPFNYYTYTGIERSVQFNFKVYSLNSQEHMIAWNKLDFLTSLAYPQGYQTVGIIAPIMKLTLGNMYVGKTGFIESLTYTIDDNAPWEIGVTPDGKMDSELKNYKLPRVVDVSVTVKFIENKSTTNTAGTAVTLYGIKPYKKVALQSGGEPKNPSTDLAKGDGSSTTIGGVANAAAIDSKGMLGGIDSTIVAKTDSYLIGLSGLTGVGKTTSNQVSSLGIAGPAISKEFAAATMKFDGLKSTGGITGKFSLAGVNTISVPPFNVGTSMTARYSPFNTDGTIKSPFSPNLKTNSFSTPSITSVNIVAGKNEKPIKLSRTEKQELLRQQGEQMLANNKSAYDSLRNEALGLSGLGK